MYWIRPYEYMTLDGNSRDYLSSKGVEVFSEQDLTGDMYLDFLNSLRNNSQFRTKDFPTISRDAWRRSHGLDNQEEGVIIENNESLIKDEEFNKKVDEIADVLGFKKNIILQGAPGTGKTYITAAVALKIMGIEVELSNHQAVMKRYKELVKAKQIFFTTFHQSTDYEDFVEGLKPEISKDKEGNTIGLTYKVKPGIFQNVCKAAVVTENSGDDAALSGINSNPTIWKVSLEGTGENLTRTDCLQNGYIRIGWNQYGDVDFNSLSDSKFKRLGGKSILRSFQSRMKIGDIVLSCYSAQEIDAIGIITGEYEYRNEGGLYPRYRKVRWIVKNIRENILDINHGHTLVQPTVYKLKISLSDIVNIVKKHSPNITFSRNEKPVILIIDEINRGNVSKVFGELVTLLEKDKRADGDHPITVTLPYSKEEFSVPSNVYIIGTMNTTDRSTGTIDYAIRRRFAFVTLPADREAIHLDIAKELFDDIESFIEDNCPKDMDIDDLMVGHSYFMTEDEDELLLKIKYEVVPLLKEYCNDGLLTCSLDELNERVEAWENLEVFDDSSVETEDEADDEENEDQE